MNAIEEKCKLKGVRLTDQRKIIAQVMSDSKQKYGTRITQMLMNCIKELQKLMTRLVSQQFIEQ